MTGRLALLCPGQGAQGRAMFDMARTDPGAGALLDTMIARAGFDAPLDDVLADDALLFSNRYAQPLVVAATLANWKALETALPAPALVAGYSIGEVAAYAVAGALLPAEAVALARMRADLMDACLRTTPRQALLSVSGLAVAAVEALLRGHDFHIAIVTGEDSVIVGGSADGADGLTRALAALGARAGLLPVEVASHTPFMGGAVAPLAAELRGRLVTDPRVPVLSGISGEPISGRGKAIEHLSRQVAEPILWRDCMDALVEAGITVALELGPGVGLSRMLQARHPQIATRSVADFRSLGGVAAWLARHVE
ncbi:ACP S-malonyltransferase [Massilia sp. CMS3.1]|uniref:ACP S-malonyltransferase n=1 Tax=Massilia sp. CMS3.1 TaxID=3373083 RepID=UPI003EE60EDA